MTKVSHLVAEEATSQLKTATVQPQTMIRDLVLKRVTLFRHLHEVGNSVLRKENIYFNFQFLAPCGTALLTMNHLQ